MAKHPRGSDLKRYLAGGDGGPVVMLDLLRFVDRALAVKSHSAVIVFPSRQLHRHRRGSRSVVV